MKKKSLVLFTVIFMFLISACGTKEYTARAIQEGDTCATCNMAVADDKYATQIVLESEEVKLFDDIGCLVKWTKDNSDKKIGASFVRDFESEEWIQLEDATFVYGKEIKTPMAYGVLSFKDENAAKSYVKENTGEVLTYDQLQKHEWAQMKMHTHKKM